jgi:Mg-chelatase subunit ChlD
VGQALEYLSRRQRSGPDRHPEAVVLYDQALEAAGQLGSGRRQDLMAIHQAKSNLYFL